jgi:hypothetical protein
MPSQHCRASSSSARTTTSRSRSTWAARSGGDRCRQGRLAHRRRGAQVRRPDGGVLDKQAKIAPADSPYGKRLAALAVTEDAGLKLNYKCYMTKEVNAFAMADGTIRLYSGLMDMMTDDELRYVIGHEMGHIKNGHTKKRMQTALAASAAQKGVAASGTRAGMLATRKWATSSSPSCAPSTRRATSARPTTTPCSSCRAQVRPQGVRHRAREAGEAHRRRRGELDVDAPIAQERADRMRKQMA